MEEINIGLLLGQLQTVAKDKAEKDLKGEWYQGYQTYLDALSDEILEVKAELELERRCFLEDELGDLLWNTVCLLEHLELAGKIDKNQVFRRAVIKYSERVIERQKGETWNDVKSRQKQALKNEWLNN